MFFDFSSKIDFFTFLCYNKYIKKKVSFRGFFILRRKNMNEDKQFEFLDLLAITSFVMQLQNIEEDEVQNKYIKEVILAISKEIEELHQENKIIIEQNEKILKLLKEK
jgi:hypothetical protein